MPQDQQAVEKPERDRRHHEQVHRSDVIRVITQKGSPPLRRPSPPPRHVLGYTRLADIDAEFEQLAVDSRRTPQRIGKAHVADQPTNLQRHLRPPAARHRLPAPVGSKPRTLPTNHGLRFDDSKRFSNIWKPPMEAGEYQSVDAPECRPARWRSPQDIDLLAQHQILSFK